MTRVGGRSGMGLEATCSCRWPGGSGAVKALLEPDALHLRGDLRRILPLPSIATVQVAGDELRLSTDEGDFALCLGAKTAERWMRKLTTPAPSLAQKLGVGPQARAWLIGEIDDPGVAASLRDGLTTIPGEAAMALAFVSTEADLTAALERHRALGAKPIWIVHGKGKAVHIGEQPTRDHMRAAGFKDTKVSAVSTTRSATLYIPPRT